MTPAAAAARAAPATVRRLDGDAPRGDLERLLEMCAEHAAYERSSFRESGQVERWRRHLESGRLRLFFAEIAGEAVGFAAATLEYSTWDADEYLHLDCLFLRPGARGRGAGTRLLEAVAAHAREAGRRQIQWQTPPWNEKAVAFYRGRGATARPKLRFVLAP
ncbi:MAG: GNAT family N-acetyltransferase [Acidobacteriota bacterium]